LDNDQAVHDRAPASINQNSLYGKNERSPGSVDGIDQNLLTRFKKRVTGLDSASPSFVAAKEKRRILEEISKLRPEE
jgi:hypothetical protein